MFRLLVTASRTWPDRSVLWARLDWAYVTRCSGEGIPLTLVHGGATGGDRMAKEWVWARSQAGWMVLEEEHLADWDRLGRRAGYVRNIHMTRTQIDLCMAFIHENSRGATHCATVAHAAGIETLIERWLGSE
jgi:hypothetical protein